MAFFLLMEKFVVDHAAENVVGLDVLYEKVEPPCVAEVQS